jgi:ABC-type multidrug transport system fused ATPase/permease subunit
MNNPAIAYHLGNQYHPIQEALVVTNLTLPDAEEHPMFYIGIYAAIGIGGGIVSLMTVCVQYFAALRASRKLFKRLLTTVIHATMRWFDTTPQVSRLTYYKSSTDMLNFPGPAVEQVFEGKP